MAAPTLKSLISQLEPNLSKQILSSLSEETLQREATLITSDSREVKPGCVFVAIKGQSADGHQFIPHAHAHGAVIVIGEEPLETSKVYARVKDSREALAGLAAAFYGHPSRQMLMVGVTGTSGKTTTTYLIESILKAAGHEVGVIGTVNFRHGERIIPSTHTTPGAVELQKLLHDMKKDGCTAIVMEVSSHALKQHRVDYIAYDAMAFTNLSREHLDFHPNMEDYFDSKAILFTHALEWAKAAQKSPAMAINWDDSYGQRLVQKARKMGFGEVLSFGLSTDHASEAGSDPKVVPSSIRVDLEGVHGQIGNVKIESPLMGAFNAANILTAVTVAQGLKIPAETIANGIRSLKSVPGRLERVPNKKGVNVLVDYAHKPDALEKVLATLKEIRGGNRLICVFGCGGDRDRTKRPVMGKIAVQNSDHVLITSDNPRTEKPEAIIQEILEGVKGHTNFTVDADRKRAIFEAIRMAKKGDIVVIAGKGHEDYQIIADPSSPGKTKKIHFDDREVAAEALSV